MIAADKILGVVLAGGQSRRMGQDKARLQIAGLSLLERSVSLLQSLALAKLVVSGDYPDYHCVPDLLSEAGPLGGLLSVMLAVDNIACHCEQGISHLLILPVDMPLMTPAPLQRLLEQDAESAGCAYQGSLFPLLVKYEPDNLNYLKQVAKGQFTASVFAMLRQRHFHFLACQEDEKKLFYNSNTPEQWQRLCL